MKNIRNYLFLILVSYGLVSCDGFLDQKPNKSILVPETVSEFEALIDNFDRMNLSPVLPFIYADDYWTTQSNWNNFVPWVQNAYTWSNDPYLPNDSPLDFSILYRKIFTANVVLDRISENPDWKVEDINRLKAKALFWRGHGYYELAVLLLPIPDKQGDSDEVKIPYKSKGALEERTEWKSASQLFPLILADLNEAVGLLPVQTQYPTQPSRFAGHALLARIYLYLGNFDLAQFHAEQVIKGDFTFLDYSKLNMQAPFPVSLFNSETIFFTNMAAQSTVSGNNVAFIHPDLIKTYQSNDLRSGFLVRNAAGNTFFKGSYISRQDVFSGIALDEIFLILSETNVRLGRVQEGINLLNQLLKTRFRNFTPYVASSNTLALDWVLDARRKSLLFRGQRWADLKRLSLLNSVPQVLTRQVENQTISLTVAIENMILKVPQREIDLQ